MFCLGKYAFRYMAWRYSLGNQRLNHDHAYVINSDTLLVVSMSCPQQKHTDEHPTMSNVRKLQYNLSVAVLLKS